MISNAAIASAGISEVFNSYITGQETTPLFVLGDALSILKRLPGESIDFCMTSPPYWNKREYSNGSLGLEKTYQDYISHLITIFAEVKRVLKPTGSFWLNIGDSYLNKSLVGIPWRVALKLTDEQGWILRNSIIWNKVKGGLDNTQDRLGNVHENIFHFVKIPQGYYYDVDAIRANPRKAKVVNGAIVSATGVSGVRYKRQIELSTSLTEEEKQGALQALSQMLEKVGRGEIADFRMIIRGQQRTTHSNSERVSGRAKELKEKGFYFLLYHPEGSKPGDVWEILPEDTQRRTEHFAPYPADLCKIPILATCPANGIVLDPFCGTGTTNLVARTLGRKSVGIDTSSEYLQIAEERCAILL
ncbi:MAG TPA: site-specific DNA-methyltransferase [Ktedonobacteraceae bacterium]|nr:site-specific DNA-methyltransferase [Ktedonobacteraceae bacterium]